MTEAADNPETSVPESPEGPVPASRKRRLWLRLPLAILLQVLLVAVLLLAWVLGTQSGLRFALGMAEDFAPGLIEVEQADGRVLGDLHLKGVKVRAPGLALDLGSLDLRWRPLGAVTGTLRIQELAARDIDVVTTPAEQEEESGPIELPSIMLPLQVELEQALVERLSVGQPGDAVPFRVDRVALAASLRGSKVAVKELSVALPEPSLHAQARGDVELADDYPVDLALSWFLAQEPAVRLEGTAKVMGDLERLTVKHDLSGSVEVKLDAVVQGVLDTPNWEGKIEILRVDLPAFGEDLPAADVTGAMETKGNLDHARVTGKLTGEAPELPDFGRLAVDLDVTWRGKVLDIAVLELMEDKSGAHLTADGTVDLNEPDGRFELLAAWEKLRWPLTGEVVAEARQGKVDAKGTFEAFEYEATADVWGRDFPEASLQLAGEGDLKGTRIGDLKVRTLDGEIRAQGKVSWDPAIGWDLVLDADGIDPGRQWPEVPAKIGLQLASAGGLEDFGYKLDGRVESTALPAAKVAVEGRGDIKGTRVRTLRIDALGGRIEGRADVGWDPQVTWDAELTADGVNPGEQWKEWEGRLGGRIASTGKLAEEGPDLRAVVEGLEGKLRGYPVDAEAKLRMQGTDIRIERLEVASGPTRLEAQGGAGERLDLTFDLSSPDLKSLLPGAAGSLAVKGSASGSREAPAVRLDLAAKGVDFAGNGVRSLGGKADLDLAAGGRLNLDLTGEGISAGGMRFGSVRVKGDGDMGSHRLSAQVAGEQLSADLSAQGGLKGDNAYVGQLSALQVRSPDYGVWRLQKAAPVSFAGETIGAGPVCIRDDGGSGGCVSFQQQAAGRWKADLDLDRLAFDLLAAFIPQDLGLDLEGEAKARGSFQARDGVISGNARLDIPKGILSSKGRERIQVLDFSSARLDVDAKGEGLNASLDLPLARLGGVEGEVSLPGWRMDDPASPNQSLRGRVRANIDDLGLISRFVPDITNVTGNLNADLGLGGTIASPGVTGQARLANGGFGVPFIGLNVKDLTFQAEAAGRDRFVYSGGFTAGEGRLEVTGQTLLGSAGARTEIRAAGKRLKLADSKEYFALVSPDVTVEVSPKGTAVTGKVLVPEARIRPRTIPAGTVSPSPDVILASKAQEDEAGRYATSIDVDLVLGKSVSIDAFGLTGRLAGNLRVLKDPGKDGILGDGQVAIIEGSYRLSGGVGLTAAIGRPLTIDPGFLSWAKSDIANPFLVLTAQREGGDVTAGLRVFGTIRQPKMTFFSASDPGMSQAEISNYLVTGIPPRGKGDNENRSLSVGTYVAPKLFVEYDYSLGDEADKIKLRYDLNRWIELQTETGDSQGADVFFKFER